MELNIDSYRLKAISLSYKTASLPLREALALDEQACRRLLTKIKEITTISEALVISTCNRTEIYYVCEEDVSLALIKLLGVEKCIDHIDSYIPYFQVINDHHEAVTHLFRVSIGLESQVVGDLQIINQVKNAYQWTADAQLAGTFLHRLLHTIFFTNKKVVQETAFRDGAASVSYATVEMIEELASQLINPQILVIGVGEIGADVIKNLASTSLENIKIANRTIEKATALAQECKCEVVPFENIQKAIQEADFVISAVQLDAPFITYSTISALSILRFKYFFDLAVPRSIEPEIEHINGVLLYNIDAINNRVNETLKRRKSTIPQVEMIVNQAIAEFDNWTKEMIVSPVIQKLKNLLEQIRKEELGRYVKQLDEVEMEKIDRITKNMMQKIIKMPVLQLKAACKRGEAETLADVLTDLFDLEKERV
jgi:glutamyl-tRNA reductase